MGAGVRGRGREHRQGCDGEYAGRLHKESERYSDPTQIASLHQRFGNYRAQKAEFETNAKISNDYARDSELSRLPGNGHLRPTIGPDQAKAAHQKAVTAKAAAQGEFQAVAADHFILQEDKLLNKPIDKAALATASEAELGSLLKARVASFQEKLGEARDQLDGKPALIYKMDMTGDQNAVKKLAGIAKMNVVEEGGFPGLVSKYGATGFDVTIEGRTITVIPLKGVK